jgi:flagellar biosynthesis/type III secretory pathway protein FliH
MSGLIKASHDPALSHIRSLDRTELADTKVSAPQARISELEKELALRDKTIGELGKARQEGFEQGFAEGKIEGKGSADNGVANRLAALDTAIKAAATSLQDYLSSTQGLAALLARASLDRIFTNDESRTALVLAAIDRQLKEIDRQSVLLISVARADFPDDADLGKLITQTAGIKVQARDDLKSGACLFDLELGRIEAGIDQQWGAMRSVLTDLASSSGTL